MQRPFTQRSDIVKDAGNNSTAEGSTEDSDIANIGERTLKGNNSNATPAVEMLRLTHYEEDESELETVEIIDLNSTGQQLGNETMPESYLVEGKNAFYMPENEKGKGTFYRFKRSKIHVRYIMCQVYRG